MFVLIRQQQERICDANCFGQLTATKIVGNVGPNLGGVRGMGIQDWGRALWENRPQSIVVPTSTILIFLN
jgi:hypothetical protein